MATTDPRPPGRRDLPAVLAELFGITFTGHQKMLLTTTDGALLGVLDRQRKYVLGLALSPLSCPACGGLICQYSASPGGFDTDGSHPDDGYQCPLCETRLTWHLALFGGGQSFSLNPGQTVKVRATYSWAVEAGETDAFPPYLTDVERAGTTQYPGSPGEFARHVLDGYLRDAAADAELEPGEPGSGPCTATRVVVWAGELPGGGLPAAAAVLHHPANKPLAAATRGPCTCKGRGGHDDPACPWYGTEAGS